ncbi:transcriptional regulator [Psychrobacillus sp. INOP01]|uniref:transcriptional regulator n=1 Tax=Psychrobacillus sp. INOP01 TaxID=2829187 RepID=UPI001BACB3D5|nr:transcriptional regulator [Psychrobacillus sp. INOP01]QUG40526.1 transcriptional regulator [Psychrobacillus sp. INOP01]
MILVQLMKPFYTKFEGNSIKMVFAYQYFSIRKDDELFHFIPVEGKEIILNAQTLQVENLSEVFVFQKGNRFIRLPLYQLLLVSDIHTHLQTILEEANQDTQEVPIEGAEEVIELLEQQNLERLIDFALTTRDESLFNKLQQYKKNNGGC